MYVCVSADHTRKTIKSHELYTLHGVYNNTIFSNIITYH